MHVPWFYSSSKLRRFAGCIISKVTHISFLKSDLINLLNFHGKVKYMVVLWQVLAMVTVLPANLYGKTGILWNKINNWIRPIIEMQQLVYFLSVCLQMVVYEGDSVLL